MFGEKGSGKVHQVGNDLVVSIRPEEGKFKAVAGLFGPPPPGLTHLFHVAGTGDVGIILGMRPFGDHKNLHLLKQPVAGLEAVPLIPLDLVERLPDGHAPAFQLYLDQGKTIYQDSHVVAVIIVHPVLCTYFVLIDCLQTVFMDRILYQ